MCSVSARLRLEAGNGPTFFVSSPDARCAPLLNDASAVFVLKVYLASSRVKGKPVVITDKRQCHGVMCS